MTTYNEQVKKKSMWMCSFLVPNINVNWVSRRIID